MPLSPRFRTGPFGPGRPLDPRALGGVRRCLTLVLVAFAVLVALRLEETPVGSLTDDAYYIAMARSLAAGQGPVVQPGPDAPAANPGLFPPGYPLLLAPLAWAQPHGLDLYRLVGVLAALAFVGLAWRLGRRDDPAPSVLILTCVALNPWLVAWTGRITSDVAFAALALAALLLARALVDGRAPSPRRYAAVVILTGLAMLTRAVGLAVLLAVVASLLGRRRWARAGIVLAGTAATQLALLLPGWSAGAMWLGDGYRAQLLAHHAGFAARAAFMGRNLAGYAMELPVLMVPAFGAPLAARLGAAATWLQAATALALLAVVAVGAARRRRDDPDDATSPLLLWYAGFTLLALANFDGWPSGVQTRLLLPLLPALWWWALRGAPGRGARAALVIVALVACLGHNLWRVARPLEEASARAGHGFVDPGDGAAWFAANTAPGDVVMAQEPLARHVRLDRPVIALGEPDLARMRERAAQYGARWLLLAPALEGGPRRLDATGARWKDLLAGAGLAPAWEDPALAISVYRLPAAGDRSGR